MRRIRFPRSSCHSDVSPPRRRRDRLSARTPRSLLLDLLDQAFDRRAWHGTGLWGSVRGLTHRDALWRPGRRRHNIWEVVLPTAYWKYIARRRLTRDPALALPPPGSHSRAAPPRAAAAA